MSESKELSVLKSMFGGENALVPINAEEEKAMDKLSQSTSFIPRVQLYTRGKPVDKGLISGGHYGIPRAGDEIEDLGKSINVLVLYRKPKALDMSDKDNLIEVNDPSSEEFKRITDMADNVKDSGCVYGTSYLLYVKGVGFLEFFCGNKSSRIESAKINTYLPQFNEGIPKPMTLKAVLVETPKWTWHAPKAEESLVGWTEEELKVVMEGLENALKLFRKPPESAEVETVEKKKGGRRR